MNEFPLTLLFTLSALVLVLVLAWFSIKLLARIGSGKMNSQHIRVTHTLPTGAREKLMLVECGGQEYFLGVTSNGISLIDKKPVETSTVSSQPVVPGS